MASGSKYTSKLTNARILVLGGSSGIGRAVVEAAVEHGAIVVIASSNEEKLAAAVAQIGEKYPDRKEYLTSHVCDLSKKEQIESNVERLLIYAAKAGPTGVDNPEGIDHVAFTAGDSLRPVPLTEATIEDLERAQTVRQYGALMLGKLSLRYMKKSPSSSFTLTGGASSHKPMPGISLFAAVGMSIEGMVNGLTVDMQPIRANLVSPGAVPTELWNQPAFKGIEEAATKKTTTGRLGKPEDVAEAYLYLMKDKFVTGANINTNGGYFFV